MADRMMAEIEIGGPLPMRLAEDLLGVIKSEGLTFEEEALDAHSVAELLKAAMEDGRPAPLRFVDNEACGCFDVLEAFLVKHRIAFDRWTEGKYDLDPELVQFRHGMKEPASRLTLQNRTPVVEAEQVKLALEHLQTGEYQRARETLQEALAPEVSPLEPLRIVDRASIPEPAHSSFSVRGPVDWTTLSRQKHWLLRQEGEEAAGLVELLDAIQDAAVDRGGIPEQVVFPNLQESETHGVDLHRDHDEQHAAPE